MVAEFSVNSEDLNHPPTSVGGIQLEELWDYRKDLNDPPTAVGGIINSIERLGGHR
jgi:hypothetical protein